MILLATLLTTTKFAIGGNRLVRVLFEDSHSPTATPTESKIDPSPSTLVSALQYNSGIWDTSTVVCSESAGSPGNRSLSPTHELNYPAVRLPHSHHRLIFNINLILKDKNPERNKNVHINEYFPRHQDWLSPL